MKKKFKTIFQFIDRSTAKYKIKCGKKYILKTVSFRNSPCKKASLLETSVLM